MEDVNIPDLSNLGATYNGKELPPQASAEDTSNWDNRAIALPDARRPLASFVRPIGPNNDDMIIVMTNPYTEQERLKSAKNKG